MFSQSGGERPGNGGCGRRRRGQVSHRQWRTASPGWGLPTQHSRLARAPPPWTPLPSHNSLLSPHHPGLRCCSPPFSSLCGGQGPATADPCKAPHLPLLSLWFLWFSFLLWQSQLVQWCCRYQKEFLSWWGNYLYVLIIFVKS